MVLFCRCLTSRASVRWGRVAGILAWIVLLGMSGGTPLLAQQPGVHYSYPGSLPPGAIGSQQLLRGGPLPGYFQPVEIHAPEGTQISLAEAGTFGEPQVSPARAGLLIGPVYRLRVTNIPLAEGLEVFPTIEVVDRLYTPRGQESRFPIQIEITEEDLRLALEGKFVTRVVYLEDPAMALPVAQAGNEQGWFEARPGENPLAVADQLGRPVAIVRLGARLPDLRQGFDMTFLYGCPPFLRLAPRSPSVPVAAPNVPPSAAARWEVR